MNPCEITAFVTALANTLAHELNSEELALVSAVLMQLADTLATIAAGRALCSQTGGTGNISGPKRE